MTQTTKSDITDRAQNYPAKPKHKDDVFAQLHEDLADSMFARELNITAAAESADDIDVTVQLVDADGSTAVSDQFTFRVRVIDETDGLIADAAAFRVTAIGTGTKVAPATLDDPAAVIQSDANGKAVFTVHDQVGASDQDVYVEIIPHSTDVRCGTGAITLTFDAS